MEARRGTCGLQPSAAGVGFGVGDPGLVNEGGKPHLPTPRQRVVSGNGDGELHSPDLDDLQVLGGSGQEQHGEVEIAKAYTLDQLVGVGLLYVKHQP
jgi:hypothetical protein